MTALLRTCCSFFLFNLSRGGGFLFVSGIDGHWEASKRADFITYLSTLYPGLFCLNQFWHQRGSVCLGTHLPRKEFGRRDWWEGIDWAVKEYPNNKLNNT